MSTPTLAVEIPEYSGVTLTEPGVQVLERLLAQVGSKLAAQYPELISSRRDDVAQAIDRQAKRFVGLHRVLTPADLISDAALLIAQAWINSQIEGA